MSFLDDLFRGAGGGDVTGPASSVVDRLVLMAATTGKVIKQSAIGVADVLLRTGAVAMTGDLDFGTHKGINAATPTISTDLATKAYVDAHVGNSDIAPVALATTGNVTLSGEQTIDGTLTSSSRVLASFQTTPSQNGVYITGAGAWTRATDFDATADFRPGVWFVIAGGTANANKVATLLTTTSITVGTTPIVFALSAASPISGTDDNKAAVASSGQVVYQLLKNANWSAVAGDRLDGSKVTPTFGAQVVSSTTAFAAGATPASVGAYRMGNADSFVGLTTLGAAVSIASVSAGDTLGLGDTSVPTVVTGSGSVSLRVGSSNILQALASTVRLLTPSLSFDSAAVAPSIIQSTDVSASVTCDDLLIVAQSGSGGTSVQAGSLGLKGGSATGGSGTRNGGAAYLQGGTGATADGYAELRSPAGTQRLRANAIGLGLYTATPVAQAARVGQLTDSTTGTPSTTIGDVGGAFSQSTFNNIHASLLAKINALELVIHNLGASA